MREHWRISSGPPRWSFRDGLLQQEVLQATKPYVHLQINQLELQVQKEEDEEEEEEEKES